MAAESKGTVISSITAVSTTVAATLLLGFLGTVKDIAIQAPLIESHMKTTSAELSSIKDKQIEQSLVLAALAKDYASRDSLRQEIEKLDSKIRELQLQQAVTNKTIDGKGKR
jgi:hypothetical protein